MKKPVKQTKKSADFGLTPLADRLIVKDIKNNEKKTDSGIYIPDTVKEDRGAKRGTIVAIGEGRTEKGNLIPMKVKQGDTILYQWGDPFTYEGEEYTIVKEGEVIAIIK